MTAKAAMAAAVPSLEVGPNNHSPRDQVAAVVPYSGSSDMRIRPPHHPHLGSRLRRIRSNSRDVNSGWIFGLKGNNKIQC